ncbi:hypothetical protein MNBD_PLANCTO02-1162 [hydrothermal vent metagenome]|uniref:DNA ligase D 3'-phosphoesterase domain-containing protein n=1 Tax=hydrothermal vent metagenome TaxID=652676 RepID=A0A3B1DF49_9ZZZZ
MPRFVILTHDHPFLHWDFMLEGDTALHTWRLLKTPGSAHEIAAEQLPDHRLIYLDYEGAISNNRGTVERFDAGGFQMIEKSEQHLLFHLNGKKIQGNYLLRQEEGSSDNKSNWFFTPCCK